MLVPGITPFEPDSPAECLFFVTIKAKMGPRYRQISEQPFLPDQVVTDQAAWREGRPPTPPKQPPFTFHCCHLQETGPACSAVSGSPGPGPVRGPSTFRQITASAQVSRSCPRTCPEETFTGSKPPVQTVSDDCPSAPSVSQACLGGSS